MDKLAAVKWLSNRRRFRKISACVSYRTPFSLAQKHRSRRSGWSRGRGAGRTPQKRCVSRETRSVNVLGNRSDWFASNTQQCTAARNAAEASPTSATASGTSVSSTGRTMGGADADPASASIAASPPSFSGARRPNRGAEHAVAGEDVSGSADASGEDAASPARENVGAASSSNGGGRSAGRRSAATR